jgi:hypothetical protein
MIEEITRSAVVFCSSIPSERLRKSIGTLMVFKESVSPERSPQVTVAETSRNVSTKPAACTASSRLQPRASPPFDLAAQAAAQQPLQERGVLDGLDHPPVGHRDLPALLGDDDHDGVADLAEADGGAVPGPELFRAAPPSATGAGTSRPARSGRGG